MSIVSDSDFSGNVVPIYAAKPRAKPIAPKEAPDVTSDAQEDPLQPTLWVVDGHLGHRLYLEGFDADGAPQECLTERDVRVRLGVDDRDAAVLSWAWRDDDGPVADTTIANVRLVRRTDGAVVPYPLAPKLFGQAFAIDVLRAMGAMTPAQHAGMDGSLAQIIGEQVAERITSASAPRVLNDVELAGTIEAFAKWMRAQGHTGQAKLSTDHMRPNLAPFFVMLSDICKPGRIDEYKGMRLAKRAERTVALELKSLTYYLAFCEAQAWIVNPPKVPGLGKKAVGNPLPTSKPGTVIVDDQTNEEIIRSLPTHAQRIARKGGRLTRIRGPFVILYDHFLRPKQLESILVPKHWRPERPDVFAITGEIDKNRDGRDMTLSARATQECVDAYEQLLREGFIPKDGKDVPLFGKFKDTARDYLKNAARAAGLSESDAHHFSSYDFKHNGVTNESDNGASLMELSAMAGVSPDTLSKFYLKPNEAHARKLVARRDARRAAASAPDGELEKNGELTALCEGGDLNPYADKGASTSSQSAGVRYSEGRVDDTLILSLVNALDAATDARNFRTVRTLAKAITAIRGGR